MTPFRVPRRQIIRDIWGDEWSVYERRTTPYRFDLVLGRPYPPLSTRGGSGGTGVIVTPALAAHLRANARRPYALPLPVGRDAIRRVRGRLGLDQQAWDDRRLEWWVERVDDLASMSVPEFVARHGREAWTRSGSLSEARVWQMRIALLGRRRRPIGWWKTPAVRALVEGDLPAAKVADRLHISPMVVRGIRWRLANVPGAGGPNRVGRPKGFSPKRARAAAAGRGTAAERAGLLGKATAKRGAKSVVRSAAKSAAKSVTRPAAKRGTTAAAKRAVVKRTVAQRTVIKRGAKHTAKRGRR